MKWVTATLLQPDWGAAAGSYLGKELLETLRFK